MEKKVLSTIRAYDLIDSGDNIVVGVSGGPDSMALLYILKNIKNEIRFNLIVVHINHGVRGDESDEDEEYVRSICMTWDIPFYSKKIDMNQYAKEKKLSSEEAGREIRYKFFRKVLGKFGKGKIAVAHNKNDQAETLVMRFLRGTGLDGLRGMEYRNGDVIRPLLDIDRNEIEKFCKIENIKTRLDRTNLEPIYRRNKIRLELIPYIERNFNTNIIETLTRTSKVMQKESDFLKSYTREVYKEIVKEESSNSISLYIKSFCGLHSAIKSRILRYSIDKINGHLQGIEEKHIQNIIDLIESSSVGKSINISNNIVIVVRYEEFVIRKSHKNNKISSFNYKIKVNNTTYIEEINSYVKCKIIDSDDINLKSKERFIKYFDYDKIKGDLYIRNRKLGDRFSPLGMSGSKKLKDFFIDEKIPRDKRDMVPIIQDKDNIIWIIGYRISELYKVDNSTKQILLIKYLTKEDINEK